MDSKIFKIGRQLAMTTFLLIGMSCSSGNAQQTTSQAEEPLEFPYPEIPAMLTDTEARLAYMCEHFWDKFNFNDSTEAYRTMGEQGLADFINLTLQADAGVSKRSGKALAEHLWKGTDLDNYLGLTEHYLFNPESPLRNDLLYAPLLKRLTELMPQTDARASKLSYMLNNVQKNQVGSIATDFTYIDRNGKTGTLHKLQANYTLLYLYDPDCENCQMTLMHMRAQLQDPRVKVLAVYPDNDLDLWKNHRLDFKEGWIDSYSPNGEIGRNQIYFIQATPSLYLLDKDKRVILKDASLNDIMNMLRVLP